MMNFREYIKSKRITVLGCGKSGYYAAIALGKAGARVFVSDNGKIDETFKSGLRELGIEFEEGVHSSRILECDLMVVSPGISVKSPPVVKALAMNIPVIGELEVGYRLTEGKYIAVTGTNGKSTVTSLIYEILRNKDVLLAGNIGEPLSKFSGESGTFVLEVSSFQLKTIDTFRPQIGLILNIDVDHLDWHESREDYIDSKANIFKNQKEGDILILNYDDPTTRNLANRTKSRVFFFSISERVEGAYFDGSHLVLNAKEEEKLLKAEELKIKGLHNIANALAASLAAYLYGKNIDVIRERLREFKGLPHRVEFVLEKNGVKFYDDSKGTNPHSVKWALKGFLEPVILIMGGEDKDLEFYDLRDEVKEHCKLVIVIGKAKGKIINTFKDIVEVKPAEDMEEAVRIAYREARNGDVVLLSPGCASFDMFKNYKERGDVFKHWVRKIAEEN